MNYICHLDEDRDHILSKFKIEARRASATVLIGHPMFVPESFSAEEVAGTLRTYNSHHSRIEVMHYQDLIESAERALALAAAPGDDQEDSRDDEEPEAPDDSAPEPAYGLDPWATPAPPFSDEPPF